MDYQPVTGVWEITMGCNMRCMHCGSICESALEDELTTEEALQLCRDIGDMGLKWITLSGGEPFTRKDWSQIVQELTQNGVMANMITNGWNLDRKTLQTAKASNVSTIAISVDGTQAIHDDIRKEGSFQRLSQAFDLMHELGIVSGAVTTVSTRNIDILEDIREFLIEKHVEFWQVQIGLPMGNMAKNDDMILQPDAIDKILDFIHESAKRGGIKVYPADCIGYYNHKETEIRKILFASESDDFWEGCHAGKRSLGILQNGDILGCTSIRDRDFIEGNIRERSLRDIWEDPNAFQWNREMRKEKLSGHCKTCDFGELCKGGCPNTRLTTKGSIYDENTYCSFNHALTKTQALIENHSDEDALYQKAEAYAKNGELSLAYLVLDNLMTRTPTEDVMNLFGFVSFMAGDYEKSRTVNQRAIDQFGEKPYALKGLGLAEYRIGENPKVAVEHLEKAAKLDRTEDLDTVHDLAVVYYEMGDLNRAKDTIEQGMSRSPLFKARNGAFYRDVCTQLTVE